MTIKIEVSSDTVETRSGVSAKTGKPYSMREQEAYAHTVNRDGVISKYPQRIKITLGDKQAPYSPGFYTVGPESFYVDRFASLSLGLVLRALPAAAAQPKAA
jgi:hypothetical protein